MGGVVQRSDAASSAVGQWRWPPAELSTPVCLEASSPAASSAVTDGAEESQRSAFPSNWHHPEYQRALTSALQRLALPPFVAGSHPPSGTPAHLMQAVSDLLVL